MTHRGWPLNSVCLCTEFSWIRPAENEQQFAPFFRIDYRDEKKPTSQPGAWIIAVLVIGLSGVWPFVKLGMLLYAWLAPTATLKKGQRARLLVFLDEYGKYSCLFQQHISWELVNFLRVVASPTWIQGGFFVSERIRVSWCAPTKNAWITVCSPMVAFERDTKTPRLSWLLVSYSGIMCFRHQMEACWHWSESYLDFLCLFVFVFFVSGNFQTDPFLNQKKVSNLAEGTWSVEDQSNLDFHWVVDMFPYKKVCY